MFNANLGRKLVDGQADYIDLSAFPVLWTDQNTV